MQKQAMTHAFAKVRGEDPIVAAVPAGSRAVKLYDFRRPDKFSKEHLRAIRNVHETFARTTGSALTSFLRTNTTVQLTSVAQVVYADYIHQLASPTVVNLVELQPLVGRIVVEMDLGITMAMLDRMMGGTGRSGPRRDELTDIELVLVRSLSKTMVSGLKEAWSVVTNVQPVLGETVLSPEFVQAALPSDIAALMLFDVQALGMSGTVSVCVPHPVIEPIMHSLSTQLWFASTRRGGSADDRTRLEDAVATVVLPVSVELGTTLLSVSDLLSIRPGDVLRLDRVAGSDLDVSVGDRQRFQGRPGTIGGNRAIQITEVMHQLGGEPA
jgi:flagellar motor switch protein FliM